MDNIKCGAKLFEFVRCSFFFKDFSWVFLCTRVCGESEGRFVSGRADSCRFVPVRADSCRFEPLNRLNGDRSRRLALCEAWLARNDNKRPVAKSRSRTTNDYLSHHSVSAHL